MWCGVQHSVVRLCIHWHALDLMAPITRTDTPSHIYRDKKVVCTLPRWVYWILIHIKDRYIYSAAICIYAIWDAFFWSIGRWWNGFAVYSWVIWPLAGRIVAVRHLNNWPVFAPIPKSWPQIQHSMTTTDQMISGPLFVILLIHWEVVKWIWSLFWGHLAIGRQDCGDQKSEQLTCFCPKSWPQIQHSMTTTHQMTISGPLLVILLIHWEVVK
jgi:hypothetical protein